MRMVAWVSSEAGILAAPGSFPVRRTPGMSAADGSKYFNTETEDFDPHQGKPGATE
jgi:hypothetical protein